MERYKINNYSIAPSLHTESSSTSGKETSINIPKDNTTLINKDQLSLNSEIHNIGVSLIPPTVETNFFWNFDVFHQTPSSNSLNVPTSFLNTNNFTDSTTSSFYNTPRIGLTQVEISSHLTRNYNSYNYTEETPHCLLPFYHPTVINSTSLTPGQMDSYPLTPQSNNRLVFFDLSHQI
uniref:Uncharacterized protein n=1 Tax=Strongyloides papillosus TaxID=174720 RepID=A0A0N5BDQ7_STREA